MQEGEVTVTPKDGAPVSFGAGVLVTFSASMSCTWEVKKLLRKHYRFGRYLVSEPDWTGPDI